MRSDSWRGQLLAAFLAASVSAGAAPQGSCTTIQGYQKVYNVPTKSTTTCVTTTKKVTSTVTPTVTVTATPSTSTSVVTSTVTAQSIVPTPTDTYTVTDTESPTVTSEAPTTTIVVTSTETDTTTTTTLGLIPTPAGFVPAVSSLPTAVAYKKRKVDRRSPNGGSVVERDLQYNSAGIAIIHYPTSPARLMKRSYPQNVVCSYTRTETVTSTVKATCKPVTKTQSAHPVTVTSTKIISTTNVVQPQADVSTTVTTTLTLTSTTFTTPTSLSTTTSTTTVTSTSTSATAHAACQTGSGNLVWSVDTGYIETISPAEGDGNISQPSASSAEECCELCFNDPACALSAFLTDLNICYLLDATTDTCTAPGLFGGNVYTDYAGSSSEFGAGYVISNGNCGAYNNVVQDPGCGDC